MLYILILVAYGILGFSFSTLLAICQTRIDGYIIVEDGADFLFVGLWWPVGAVILSCLSVVQLTITGILKLKILALGRYILRFLDSWVSWLRG
jgi:hypothetical protein